MLQLGATGIIDDEEKEEDDDSQSTVRRIKSRVTKWAGCISVHEWENIRNAYRQSLGLKT
jgi:hypothetical protein